jgi:hypothetical protein
MNPYVTVEDADAFFETRIHNEYWLDAETEEKLASLVTATRAIDCLSFISSKTEVSQEREWPRGGVAEIPEGIKIACCEEALSLLEGRDPILEQENLRALSQTYANVKMAFEPRVLAEYIINGITSPIAWRYIQPYLSGKRQITLSKV